MSSLTVTSRGLMTIGLHDLVLSPNGLVELDSVPQANSETVSLAIALSDAVVGNFSKTFQLADSINLISRVNQVFDKSITDPISLTDIVRLVNTKSISDPITLTQTLANDVFHSTSSSIVLTDTLFINLVRTFPLTDVITLISTATFADGHISDVITLTDHVDISKEFSITDTLTLTQAVVAFKPAIITSPIVLTDTLSVVKTTPASSTITLTQTLTTANVLNLHLTDIIALADGIYASSPSVTKACNETFNVVLGTRKNVLLTFPFVTPTNTITLRNPLFGNSYTINTLTLIRRTQSGQLDTARGINWPTIETFKVSFEALDTNTISNFLDFVQQSAALEIGYLDQENRQWRGFITPDTIETSQTGIGCRFNTSFEFRGALA